MADTPSQISGRCLCGSVTYRADAEPLAQAACHCTECQRQTGTAFSVVVGVPLASLKVEGDTLSSFTTTGEQHGTATQRRFCSACGSPIFSTSEAMPEFAFLKAGTLDDASWLDPQLEVWTRSAQPWSPHFEGATHMELGPG
jgi:hypothetical protein